MGTCQIDQVSWTLDNTYYDWCVGRLAEYLGKNGNAKLFGARAHNYRNIYDPQVGFMRAKDRSGQRLEWHGETAFGQGCTHGCIHIVHGSHAHISYRR
jgi:putative alpha-1,2-mannosidase